MKFTMLFFSGKVSRTQNRSFELTRLGGLAQLGEILLSLTNSKVSQPTQVVSQLILPGSRQGEMKVFHMNTSKWVSPARWDRVFFNNICSA